MKPSPLTPGFFRFLLGFSAILLLSFGMLIYLSGSFQKEPSATQPASTSPTNTP